jgi:MFS family permease
MAIRPQPTIGNRPRACAGPGSTGRVVAGWLGTTLGGGWADAWRRRTPAGRLQVAAACPILTLPLAVWMLVTEHPQLAFLLAFPVTLASSLWIGAGASTVQDLVLPRMRGSASAAYLLLVTFIGLALGPYTVGRLSVALGDLRMGMLSALIAGVVGAILLLAASRHVAHDEATRVARARAAGEET